MLLPLLAVVALLIGVLSFTAIVTAQMAQPKRHVQPSLPNQQVSLWSLVLFLFFPWSSTQNNAPL